MWCWFFFIYDRYILWSDEVEREWLTLWYGDYYSLKNYPPREGGDFVTFKFRNLGHFVFVLTFLATVFASITCYFFPPLMTIKNQLLIFVVNGIVSSLISWQFYVFPTLGAMSLLLVHHMTFFVFIYYFTFLVPFDVYDPFGFVALLAAREVDPFVTMLPPPESFLPFYLYLAPSLVILILLKFQYPVFPKDFHKDSLLTTYPWRVTFYLVRTNQLLCFFLVFFYCLFFFFIILRFPLCFGAVIYVGTLDFFVATFFIHFIFLAFFLLFLHCFLTWDLIYVPHTLWIHLWARDNPESVAEFRRRVREMLISRFKTHFVPMAYDYILHAFFQLLFISFVGAVHLGSWYGGPFWIHGILFYNLLLWIFYYLVCLLFVLPIFFYTLVSQQVWLDLISTKPWKTQTCDMDEYKKGLRQTHFVHFLEYLVVLILAYRLIAFFFFGMAF